MKTRYFGFLRAGLTAPNFIILVALANFTVALSSEPPVANEMSGLEGQLVGQRNFPRVIGEDPTQSRREQAVGSYSAGRLISTLQFPLETDTVIKLRRPRRTHYTTYDLAAVILWAARIIHERYPYGERLQVVDIAKKGGGSIGNHESHTNGLDADILYFRNDHREEDPYRRSHRFTSMVIYGRRISANFDFQRNWWFIKALVATGRIGRIFVHPVIKASLCDYAEAIGEKQHYREVFRRLRPWPHHADHMHLRITCPAASPRCRDQVEPDGDDGCRQVLRYL